MSLVLYTPESHARYAVCGSVGWTVMAQTPRQVFGDIAPDGRGTAVRIRGNPNLPGGRRRRRSTLELLGASYVALTGSGSGSPIVVQPSGRNRGAVESSNHVLASGNKVRWRGWVHAKRRKEAAGSIALFNSGRGDVDLFVGLSVESAKRTPTA